MNAPGANRKLLTFLVIIPLAIYLGWTLSEPLSGDALLTVTGLTALLLTPVMMRWHRPVLIFAWNTSITFAFLPGSPPLWLLVSGISLLIVILEGIMDKQVRIQNVPAITRTLLVLVAVVFVTGYLRGGLGTRAMGSEAYGGKKYIFIFGAVIGYFALSSARIPAERVSRYTKLFLLGGLTYVVSNLAYFGGPAFYWLYFFFPVGDAMHQIGADTAGSNLLRLGGISFAMMGVFSYLLARFSIREIFSARRPWLLPLLALLALLVGLGGFRSSVIILVLLLLIKYLAERMLWTHLSITVGFVSVLVLALIVPFAEHLPLSIQRSLSFLPFLNLDAGIRMDAWASTDWRLQMWSIVIETVPEYLWLGKGYVINPTDMFMADVNARRGGGDAFEGSMISGDYHSGPLTVLVNFGIPGLLAFLWFCWVGMRSLHRNFRHGDPALATLNGLIYALFLTRVFAFFILAGDIANLAMYTGLLGFSVALNGGVREKAGAPVRAAQPALAPGGMAPAGAGMATARPAIQGRGV